MTQNHRMTTSTLLIRFIEVVIDSNRRRIKILTSRLIGQITIESSYRIFYIRMYCMIGKSNRH